MAWKRAVCYARKAHCDPQRRAARSGQTLSGDYPQKPMRQRRRVMSEHELSNAIHAFILNSWETLSPEEKCYLGFDSIPGSEGERQGLKYLATLFRDFTDASFERALDARQRRLNASQPQGGSDAGNDAKDR